MNVSTVQFQLAFDQYPGLRPALCLLHSQLNSNDQQRVFEPTRNGERKVVSRMEKELSLANTEKVTFMLGLDLKCES